MDDWKNSPYYKDHLGDLPASCCLENEACNFEQNHYTEVIYSSKGVPVGIFLKHIMCLVADHTGGRTRFSENQIDSEVQDFSDISKAFLVREPVM